MKDHASASKANRQTERAAQHDSSAGENAAAIAPPAYGIEFVDRGLAAGGQSLSAGLRGFAEPRFGRDFSEVRVHTDERAAESAKSVNALAYTVGKDIVFGAGQYQPERDSGRRILAHELAHVVQQSSASPDTRSPLPVTAETGAHEADAHRAARSAALGRRAVVRVRTPLQVARLSQLEHVQTFNDEDLASEHEAVRAWLLVPENEKDPAHAGRLAYFNQLESEVSRRNPARIAAQSRRSVLVNFVTNAPAIQTPIGAIGAGSRAQAAFFMEFGFGLKDAFLQQPAARKLQLATRMVSLAVNPSLDFQLGYGKGILLGVWGEIKGIVDLILLLPRFQLKANEWVMSLVSSSEKRQALLRKGQALKEALDEAVQKAAEEIIAFFRDPETSIKRLQALLDAMLSRGLEKAYRLGHDAVEASFQYLEKPDGELGEELGKIAGMVLFQVVLLVATDAIGNLITKGAGLLARLGKAVLEGIGKVFSGVKAFVAEVLVVMRNLGRTVMRAMEGVLGALERLIQRVEAFLAELTEVAELSAPERALAGGGTAPKGALPAPAPHSVGVGKSATMGAADEVPLSKVEQRGKDILDIFEEGQKKTPPQKSFHPGKGAPVDEAALDEANALKQRGITEDKPVGARLAEAEEGILFDTLEGQKYPKNQVPIRDKLGKIRRLDSYDPINKEIISRKSLSGNRGQIAFTEEFTMIEHFQEFKLKYPNGATIADVPAAKKMGLAGEKLVGKYVLEVPVQEYAVPERILQEAQIRGITIRDINGKTY